ncbi:MAG: hypothetical protein JJT78_01560 [Leptospira sp.]|nr:hypothetical protein [Leptospira sp.]
MEFLRNLRISVLIVFIATAIGGIFLTSGSLKAQSSPQFPSPDPQDRFQCTKIPTQVDGIDYDKTLKCETRDAICYIIEGFAMSCVPKFIPQPDEKSD